MSAIIVFLTRQPFSATKLDIIELTQFINETGSKFIRKKAPNPTRHSHNTSLPNATTTPLDLGPPPSLYHPLGIKSVHESQRDTTQSSQSSCYQDDYLQTMNVVANPGSPPRCNNQIENLCCLKSVLPGSTNLQPVQIHVATQTTLRHTPTS